MVVETTSPGKTTSAKTDRDEIARAIKVLHGDDAVVEIRCKDGKRITAGYFDDRAKLVKDVSGITRGNVYVNLNKLDPDLLARCANRIDYGDKLTADENVKRRLRLLVDCDPQRVSHISSTDEEHDASLSKAGEIAKALKALGWPDPIIADSGNGGHLLYLIDLPNDAAALELIKRVLAQLSIDFDDDADCSPCVTVDQTVSNAARITKLYGTVARKGDSIPERPHRQSRLLEVPDTIEIVTREQLEAYAGPEPEPPEPKRYQQNGHANKFDLQAFLDGHLEITSKGPYTNANGSTYRYKLETCPLCGESDGSAVVLQFSDGRIGYRCHHNRCVGKGWAELREHCEPGYRERRDSSGGTKTSGHGDGDDGDDAGGGKKSQATLLVELADGTDLFHDAAGESYARFYVDDHWEVTYIRNRQFRRYLSRLFFLKHRKTPSSQALQDALGVIEGKALYDGDVREVYVRVAEHNGCIYIDLANDKWQVIEVSAAGWKVVDESPVMFRRAKAMLPLPIPVEGGDINELRKFANVTDDDWPLVLAWVVTALRPKGPYPVLAVAGEHGSAKSSLCRYLRQVIDPNKALLRSEPREPRDLMIAANNGLVLGGDNLSSIPPWLSDCYCRLSTGGGFSTRTLYENDEETIFEAQRPVMINGISELATRSDLLDRCLLLNLPRIDQGKRQTESDLDRDFNEAHPRILGALLTAVATAIKRLPDTKLESLPRMADAALWVTAAEPELGLEPGEFMEAYTANRAAGNELALDASPIAKLLICIVEEADGSWTGTASELLLVLDLKVGDTSIRREKFWPKTANVMSSIVRRLAPNFRAVGIEVEFDRTGPARTISFRQREQEGNSSSSASPASSGAKPPGFSHFSNDDPNDDPHPPGNSSSLGSSLQNGQKPREYGTNDGNDADDDEIPLDIPFDGFPYRSDVW